ncbi:MAG: hypothetical protein AAGF24_05310 [Cyanobacteria bacterium P01_H01_bin.121]
MHDLLDSPYDFTLQGYGDGPDYPIAAIRHEGQPIGMVKRCADSTWSAYHRGLQTPILGFATALYACHYLDRVAKGWEVAA